MFTRSQKNPILIPNKNIPWESTKVYNPGVILNNGYYHMLYRAVGGDEKSRLGYAQSKDGINFEKLNHPILEPNNQFDLEGVEDPRITKIGNIFFLTYTSYNGITARLSLAISKNFIKWKKIGPILNDWDFSQNSNFIVSWDKAFANEVEDKNWSKAGGIISEKISDNYWMLFGDRNIWLAYSRNAYDWTPINKPFITPRKNHFDSVHVEIGPPPIKTKHGWLVLYHGVDKTATYRLGAVLLDLHAPTKILARTSNSFFEPKTEYELKGEIDLDKSADPKVIFCTGAILKNDNLEIYYGCSDSSIATASAKIEKLFTNFK